MFFFVKTTPTTKTSTTTKALVYNLYLYISAQNVSGPHEWHSDASTHPNVKNQNQSSYPRFVVVAKHDICRSDMHGYGDKECAASSNPWFDFSCKSAKLAAMSHDRYLTSIPSPSPCSSHHPCRCRPFHGRRPPSLLAFARWRGSRSRNGRCPSLPWTGPLRGLQVVVFATRCV